MRTELRKAAESQVGPRTCLCTFAAPRTLAHWQNGRLIACGLPAFLSHLAACLRESCRPGLGPRSRSGEFRQSCYLSVSLSPKKCRRCPYVRFWEMRLLGPSPRTAGDGAPSEERRVGKEGRSRWSPY